VTDLDGVEAVPGRVAAELRAEFPELGLLELELGAVAGRSPAGVRERLRGLSSRFRGADAVHMRRAAVPHAHRVFFRHIGLDPDAVRPPAEAAAVDRLLLGEFPSRNLLDDALLIALVETGVAVWALDAARVDGPLELRLARAGEDLGRGERAPPVPPGRIVVADAGGPLALLFGELARGHGVTAATRRMRLFTVTVPHVPAIHVEEALATAVDVLRS
jgi:DNA/RNA-binding domain of Phe-tRNA-synthetase-like protein